MPKRNFSLKYSKYSSNTFSSIQFKKNLNKMSRMKKAYRSIVNESIIQIAKDTKEKSNYDSLRCYFKRKNIPFNFNYCRKIFATYLRMQGIDRDYRSFTRKITQINFSQILF